MQSIGIAPVLTSDATPTSVVFFTLPVNSAIDFDVRILAISSTGTVRKWRFLRTAKRGATVLSFVGTGSNPLNDDADAGASTWAVALSSPSGGIVNIVLTGQAATNIKWSIEGDYQIQVA